MKAIQTKYLGFTHTKPARIRVSAEGVPSKIYSRSTLPDRVEDCHAAAARKFADEQGWSFLVSGGTANPDVWVHCFIPSVVTDTLKLADILFDTVSCSERFDVLKSSVKQSLKQLNA